MLYSVTLSDRTKSTLQNFEERLRDKGVIVHTGFSYVIFDSVYGWDFLRECFPEYIVAQFNPECELGKEIMAKGVRHTPSTGVTAHAQEEAR